MNHKTLNVGIIGSGFAAKFHFEALRRVYSTNINILGAFARNKYNLDTFTAECGINSFDSLEHLIDRADVIHLCTPPSTHETMALQCLINNKHVIIEKPFTGYFGDGSDSFDGTSFPRETGLKEAVASIQRMLNAEKESKGSILYAENWIYAPAIQKEREIIEKTKAQILWIQGQQSHSGSHSLDYGKWHLSGGGSLMGKGSHPLSAAIYLKHVEGNVRNGAPIHPKTISCRTHSITKLPQFDLQENLRDSYTDIEDYAHTHIVFEDGSIADITASELLQGGVKNYIEVHANNHRTICNIAPNNSMMSYNPTDENFKDIYVVEKTGTKQGWSHISPDEAWFNGYQHEMDAFYRAISNNLTIASNSTLAADVIATIYAGYLSAEQKGTEVSIPSINKFLI